MRIKADGDFVRRQNRLLLVEALRLNMPLARTEIGRETGLSLATVTSITSDLMAEGILVSQGEDWTGRQGPGRPLQRLKLNGEAASALGIEISIDGISMTLANYDGGIVARRAVRQPTPSARATTFGRRLALEAKQFVRQHKAASRRLARIGVSVQGIADVRRGSIAWSPAFGARDIPILAPLRDAFGVEAAIANDTNLAAQALLARAPLARSGSAAVVFVGYGVGMGLIIDGRVYDGPTGAAAEFGHMTHIPGGPLCRCGGRGCLEAYAGDYGIHRAAKGLPPASEPPHAAIDGATMSAIESKARAGNRMARSAYRQAGLALGYCLARAIVILDLERVTLMGSGLSAYGLMETALREGLAGGLPTGLRKDIPIDVWPSANNTLMAEGLLRSTLAAIDRQLIGRLGTDAVVAQRETAL